MIRVVLTSGFEVWHSLYEGMKHMWKTSIHRNLYRRIFLLWTECIPMKSHILPFKKLLDTSSSCPHLAIPGMCKKEDCIGFWWLSSDSCVLDLFASERHLEKMRWEDSMTADGFVHWNCLNPESPYQQGRLESKTVVVLINGWSVVWSQQPDHILCEARNEEFRPA